MKVKVKVVGNQKRKITKASLLGGPFRGEAQAGVVAYTSAVRGEVAGKKKSKCELHQSYNLGGEKNPIYRAFAFSAFWGLPPPLGHSGFAIFGSPCRLFQEGSRGFQDGPKLAQDGFKMDQVSS